MEFILSKKVRSNPDISVKAQFYQKDQFLTGIKCMDSMEHPTTRPLVLFPTTKKTKKKHRLKIIRKKIIYKNKTLIMLI